MLHVLTLADAEEFESVPTDMLELSEVDAVTGSDSIPDLLC